ncbi:hypothetical protein ACKLNR_012800 [Fusarium oxysporum f. sp. zingiberi]
MINVSPSRNCLPPAPALSQRVECPAGGRVNYARDKRALEWEIDDVCLIADVRLHFLALPHGLILAITELYFSRSGSEDLD